MLESPKGCWSGCGRGYVDRKRCGKSWENFNFHLRVRFDDDAAVVTLLLDFKVAARVGIPISADTQNIDI
jgi:hypothetical protein